jgi:nucleoid-associated protein YgaU
MTSSIKFGLIGLAVIGVGLGAYLVNRGLKDDGKVNTSPEVRTVTNESNPANAAADTGQAAPGPLAAVDDNTGRVASPPSVPPRDLGNDSERSFRPHTPDITKPPVTPPPTPGTIQEDTGRADIPPPAPGSLTPTDPGTGATTITPPPAAPGNEQMSLRDAAPLAGAGGSTTVKPVVPTPTVPEKTTIHIVQAGDTFSGLAVKYLGSQRYATLIAKANPNIKPHRLLVGAKLKIPPAPVPTTAPATGGPTTVDAQKPKAAAPPVDPARAYTVKPNDSWTSLARQFLGNDNWTVLYELNKERFPRNSRMLRPGMVLEIPPKDTSSPKK